MRICIVFLHTLLIVWGEIMDSSAGSGQNVYPQGQAFRGVAENRQGREEGGDLGTKATGKIL